MGNDWSDEYSRDREEKESEAGQKEKVVKEVIEEIKSQDDQNNHFKYDQLQPTDLITIVTNHQLRDLSQLLRVPAKSISQTTRYRKLKSIESIEHDWKPIEVNWKKI